MDFPYVNDHTILKWGLDISQKLFANHLSHLSSLKPLDYLQADCFCIQRCVSRPAKADKLLQTRQITVNLFAQCNTGKSTILNAILGDK